ncbi:uncharacterized protein METZ01_LOCUS388052 [marine metagenome]|uniref:Uncharacterized protein n=1 Tax=marine metagenome TaxID=408172 RepID=A0A382UNB7_9ZZZZ
MLRTGKQPFDFRPSSGLLGPLLCGVPKVTGKCWGQ